MDVSECLERRSTCAVTRPALRDSDIRLSLSAWLAKEHADDPSTAIYEELAIPRPTARVDLAVVNGCFVGYEIKSDVDSLSRLAGQVKSYGHVFERVFLVTTPKRALNLKKIIPEWWGILKTKDDGSFSYVRKARLNKELSVQHALYILEKPELSNIAKRNCIQFRHTLLKGDIITLLIEKLPRRKIMAGMRDELKGRNSRKTQLPSS